MRPKEFAIPVQEPNESVDEYMYRYGVAVATYNKSICSSIDRDAIKARYQSQTRNPKSRPVKTIHDILSGNVDRVRAFKAGKFDPFEI